jgi:hypothetical protein
VSSLGSRLALDAAHPAALAAAPDRAVVILALALREKTELVPLGIGVGEVDACTTGETTV